MVLTNQIVDKMVSKSVIKESEKVIYTYGIDLGITMMFNILTACMIGVVYGLVLESMMFLALYIPLRTYAGGYHARTGTVCYIMSTGLIIVAMFVIKYITVENWIHLIFFILLAAIINTAGPVMDENKPLSEEEKVRYRKKADGLLIVIALLIGMGWLMELNMLIKCIGVMSVTLSAMLVTGTIRNKIKGIH